MDAPYSKFTCMANKYIRNRCYTANLLNKDFQFRVTDRQTVSHENTSLDVKC